MLGLDIYTATSFCLENNAINKMIHKDLSTRKQEINRSANNNKNRDSSSDIRFSHCQEKLHCFFLFSLSWKGKTISMQVYVLQELLILLNQCVRECGSTIYVGLTGTVQMLIHMYYCMTGRAIQGNILFKIDHIGRTRGRDDTEVENGIFPVLPNPRIAIIDLLYEFHVTIVTGNNERAIR